MHIYLYIYIYIYIYTFCWSTLHRYGLLIYLLYVKGSSAGTAVAGAMMCVERWGWCPLPIIIPVWEWCKYNSSKCIKKYILYCIYIYITYGKYQYSVYIYIYAHIYLYIYIYISKKAKQDSRAIVLTKYVWVYHYKQNKSKWQEQTI